MNHDQGFPATFPLSTEDGWERPDVKGCDSCRTPFNDGDTVVMDPRGQDETYHCVHCAKGSKLTWNAK